MKTRLLKKLRQKPSTDMIIKTSNLGYDLTTPLAKAKGILSTRLD